MNANGFFFFKFADQVGMQKVLTAGPWIIRSQPLFLEVWSLSIKLEKREVKKVQVWVKFHEVPLATYTEDGLSLIATTIGEPKALDSFTTSMCVDMWGRSSFARALVEISADTDLKEELTIAVPCLDGDGFVKEKIYVDYEWCPHRCGRCCVFGHNADSCPLQSSKVSKDKPQQSKFPGYDKKMKQPIQDGGPSKRQPIVDEDGYTTVQAEGYKQGNETVENFVSSNPFDVLNDTVPDNNVGSSKGRDGGVQDSDDEEVIEGYNEMDEFMMEGTRKAGNTGASTPDPLVSNGWNPELFDVLVLAQSSQVIHLQLMFKDDKRILFCSVVYADNYYVTRRDLWAQLSLHKHMVADKPWIIMGDFNSALFLEDKSMGTSAISVGMRDF
ncbi:uncharacterized protein LOC110866501 [Helianthus annuus]|uniref:uncharacterized protein LOC110866501 n=1 Tax=Helianthus annuus TaxID=4232 RepID=UPI000B909EA2|nr:uncharacterized protein LOC110866501 [Helianthus annuus]